MYLYCLPCCGFLMHISLTTHWATDPYRGCCVYLHRFHIVAGLEREVKKKSNNSQLIWVKAFGPLVRTLTGISHLCAQNAVSWPDVWPDVFPDLMYGKGGFNFWLITYLCPIGFHRVLQPTYLNPFWQKLTLRFPLWPGNSRPGVTRERAMEDNLNAGQHTCSVAF